MWISKSLTHCDKLILVSCNHFREKLVMEFTRNKDVSGVGSQFIHHQNWSQHSVSIKQRQPVLLIFLYKIIRLCQFYHYNQVFVLRSCQTTNKQSTKLNWTLKSKEINSNFSVILKFLKYVQISYLICYFQSFLTGYSVIIF